MRAQKVVMRDKSRRARWNRIKSVSWTILKYSTLCLVLAWGADNLHRWLFRSGNFMVKSLQVVPYGRLDQDIEREVAFLKGQSILKAPLGRTEERIREKYPAVSSVELRRSFPDRIEVSYSLRSPVALIKRAGALCGVDEEGNIFSLEHFPKTVAAALPEMSLFSERSLAGALQFVKMWTGAVLEGGPAISDLSLRRIAMDHTEETSLILKNLRDNSVMDVIWGSADQGLFNEKFSRFKEVCSDLQEKAIAVRTINLRGIPQEGGSVLEDRKIVGRVVVRPAKN